MTTSARDDIIEVAGAPSIPGLVFRRWRPGEDEAAMANLHTRCFEADRIPIRETADDIAKELRHMAGFDPAEDLVLGELRGRLVVEGRPNRLPRSDATITLRSMCWIDPSVRGRDIGRALLHHQQGVRGRA